jgi:hypothetical protein
MTPIIQPLTPASSMIGPKQLPAFAVEPHHLQLLVDAIIGRRRMGGYAGQRQAAGEVLQTGRLPLDVCRIAA